MILPSSATERKKLKLGGKVKRVGLTRSWGLGKMEALVTQHSLPQMGKEKPEGGDWGGELSLQSLDDIREGTTSVAVSPLGTSPLLS